MLQLFSLYLNNDKVLQSTTASGSEFQTFTDLLLNSLSLLLMLKRLIFEMMTSCVGVVNYNDRLRGVSGHAVMVEELTRHKATLVHANMAEHASI